MTDSWTDGANEVLPDDAEAARSISPSGVAPPTEYDDDQVPPRPEEIPRMRIYPSAEYERTHAMREALRTDELEHLEELRKRVQQGMDDGLVSLESGTTMLLNISKARTQLGGVTPYGAF